MQELRRNRCKICTHIYKVRCSGIIKTVRTKGLCKNTMLVSFTLLASKASPLESFFTQLKLVEEFSKLFGSGRLDKGRRALEVGLDGSLGGKSFGLTSSSLRRIDSNISSMELRVIIDGETDIIFLCFKQTLKFLWHC